MKAYFDFGEELQGVMELNKENINKADDFCLSMSGDYLNYVLSLEWDDENNIIHLFPDGPWEC